MECFIVINVLFVSSVYAKNPLLLTEVCASCLYPSHINMAAAATVIPGLCLCCCVLWILLTQLLACCNMCPTADLHEVLTLLEVIWRININRQTVV